MAIMEGCMAVGKQAGSGAVAKRLHVIHKQEAETLVLDQTFET